MLKLGRDPCGLLRVPLCVSLVLRVLVHRLRWPLLTWKMLQIVWCMTVLKTIIYCSKGLNAHPLFWTVLFKQLKVCIGLTLPYCNLSFSLRYVHGSLVTCLQKTRSDLKNISEYRGGLNELCCSLLLICYLLFSFCLFISLFFTPVVI